MSRKYSKTRRTRARRAQNRAGQYVGVHTHKRSTDTYGANRDAKSGQFIERSAYGRDTTHKAGHKAPYSGTYEIIGRRGRVVGVRSVAAGDSLPPTPKTGQVYKLRKEVKPIHTSVSSASAMDKTTETFSRALRRLAKK